MFEFEVLDPPREAPWSRCRPSGWLALDLDTTAASPSVLEDAELVEALVGFDRVASWALARQARVLAELARRRPPDDPAAARSAVASVASEFAPDEVALALRCSRVAAAARLQQAVVLDQTLPETLRAWEHGRIDQTKVRAIEQACAHLSDQQARAVQHRVLARAGEQTPGQLRAALARAVLAIDPDSAAARHAHARGERRVVLQPEPDAMASLWALLPAPDAIAAYGHLGALARSLGAEDPRGMDARRADLLTELLTGRRCACAGHRAQPEPEGHPETGAQPEPEGHPETGTQPEAEGHPGTDTPTSTDHDIPASGAHGPPPAPDAAPAPPARRAPAATVHVTMPLTMLMGLDESPGHLRGYGPIPAPLARALAADATWHRLLTDPVSGVLLDYGRTTYTPPVALADFVRARDLECRNPICRRSAADADLDHTLAWADGGTTAEHNLYAGCRHDHRLKTHAPGWHVHQNPDATITYTTPTGHTYTSHPHNYRPDPPPDDPPPDDPDPPPF